MSKAATSKKQILSAVNEKELERDKIMEATRAFIEKATGQKPLGSDIKTWPHIRSGALAVDDLIGGTPLADGSGLVCPGFPKGRIVEIYGPESSGKTTLALSAIVQAQKASEAVLFLDFENALHHGYAKAVGVDFDPRRLMYFAPSTFEEGLRMLYVAIKQNVGLIVVDSVAAMVPAAELDKKLGDVAAIGALARAMSTNLPKMTQWLKPNKSALILINQVRATISTGGHGPGDDNTAGGKAVKFYASVRLKLTRIKSEFVERPDPVTMRNKKMPFGNVVQVKAVKNKMDGKQGHSGEIFIRYGYGVDEYLSVIQGAIPRKIVVQKKASYEFGREIFKGRDRLRSYLVSNPAAFESMRERVTAAILSEAPKAIEGDVEDEDILSDMRQDIGDDEIIDSPGEESALEEIIKDS